MGSTAAALFVINSVMIDIRIYITARAAIGPSPAVALTSAAANGRFAMMYDVFLWGHKFDLLSIVGIVLVVAPTAWLLFRERRILADEFGGRLTVGGSWGTMLRCGTIATTGFGCFAERAEMDGSTCYNTARQWNM